MWADHTRSANPLLDLCGHIHWVGRVPGDEPALPAGRFRSHPDQAHMQYFLLLRLNSDNDNEFITTRPTSTAFPERSLLLAHAFTRRMIGRISNIRTGWSSGVLSDITDPNPRLNTCFWTASMLTCPDRPISSNQFSNWDQKAIWAKSQSATPITRQVVVFKTNKPQNWPANCWLRYLRVLVKGQLCTVCPNAVC